MPRPRYSIGFLLALIAVIGASLAIYRYLNPPPAYPLPTKGGSIGRLLSQLDGTGITGLTAATLEGIPTWDRRRNSNPPCSANEAMVRADRARRRLIEQDSPSDESNADQWTLTSAELRPFLGHPGHWYWHVRFLSEPTQASAAGAVRELSLVVLMDGSVPENLISLQEVWRKNQDREFRLPVYVKPGGP